MKIKDLLSEDKIGHKRLVSSILSIVKNKKGKYPSREKVSAALNNLKNDKEFLTRIRKKAKTLNSDGYYWNAIRRRVAASL